MLPRIFEVENSVSDYGNVGGIKLPFTRDTINVLKHVGSRTAETKQNDYISVALDRFLIAQNGKSAKLLMPHKAVTCKNAADRNTAPCQLVENFVRTISHAVEPNRLFCRRQLFPHIHYRFTAFFY